VLAGSGRSVADADLRPPRDGPARARRTLERWRSGFADELAAFGYFVPDFAGALCTSVPGEGLAAFGRCAAPDDDARLSAADVGLDASVIADAGLRRLLGGAV